MRTKYNKTQRQIIEYKLQIKNYNKLFREFKLLSETKFDRRSIYQKNRLSFLSRKIRNIKKWILVE
jgi:hypothetical protein